MSDNTIYLDANATAPLCAESADAMAPWMRQLPANPSAVHRPGQRARAALEHAREQVAELCAPGSEVVFTGSGTEANNLALWGRLGWPPDGEIIVSAVEHPAVLEPAEALRRLGVGVTVVPVDSAGRADPATVGAAISERTRLVSVMAANNEVGTLQPVAEIAAIARDRGVTVHCDAVQALAWSSLEELVGDVDMLTLAAHKIGGPVGIGALVLRRPLTLEPFLRGGGQQRGRRPGTEATALAVGFGAACARIEGRRDAESIRIHELTARLRADLSGVDGTVVTVPDAATLPNTLHLCVTDLDGAALVARLDLEGVAVSGGSACSSGVAHGSHVLAAMGVPESLARGALRLSLGYDTTGAEIERAGTIIGGVIRSLRAAPARLAGS